MTRRALIAGVASSAAVSCRRHTGSGFPGYALIATAGESSLAVIDLNNFRVEPPVALDAPPASVITGGNGSAYVLTPSIGRIHKINSSRKVVGSLHLAPGLTQISADADGKSLFAISSQTAELVVADLQRFNVSARRYELKAAPRQMDVLTLAPGRNLIATSGGGNGWVELIDFAGGNRSRRKLDGHLGDLRFRKDGQLLLVSNLSTRSLTALSIPQLEVVADLPLAMKPQNLCFNADFGQLFVTGDGMDGVAIVFPYRILQVDQTVLAGRDPGVMASCDNPGLLFVASASGSDVCVLNIDTRKVIGLVDVTQQPSHITITPDNQYALVLNRKSGDVAFIRIPAIRTNPAMVISKLGASLFTMLFVGKEPVNAAIVHSQA